MVITEEKQKKHTKNYVVGLIGNPNSGKSTIFSTLTGARQKVGNYPGVTVEKKEGTFVTTDDKKINIVDLPGVYSLSAYSVEEIVSRDFIIQEKPDIIVDVVDATNIERSLFLAVELKELGVPLIIALNMSDISDKMGHVYDLEKMSALFGAKFVKTVGTKKDGIASLKKAISEQIKNISDNNQTIIHYHDDIEKEIEAISKTLNNSGFKEKYLSPRWMAVKLLCNDENVIHTVKSKMGSDADLFLKSVDEIRKKIQQRYSDDSETLIAEGKYGFIKGILKESAVFSLKEKLNVTEKIDKIILNRVLGLPIFLLIMYGIFYVSVDLASPLIDKVDALFKALGEAVKGVMSEGVLRSLIADGVIGGVGGVLVFVPQILILFVCIALLEATGYMARAAFVIDRVMSKVGLHGKSFIPMLIGFGCTVPAVMATRTLENEKDRKTTMLASTFMSCGARFPVYVLFTGALFPQKHAAWVIYSIYLLGIVIGLLTAKIMKKFVYKSKQTPFVMELPAYRMPTIRGVLAQMWEKFWMYLKRAGTILLAVAIIFWFLTSYPKLSDSEETPFNERTEAVNKKLNTDMAAVVKMLNITSNEQNAQTENEKILMAHAVFKDMAEKYKKIEDDFEKKVKDTEAEEGSEEYKTLNAEKEKLLKALEQQNAGIYQAVAKYYELKKQAKEEIQGIENEKVALEKKRSYAGRMGSFLAPVFAPIGLNDWKVSLGLISGFAAKEVVVATLGSVYAIGEEEDEKSVSLRTKILNDPFFQQSRPVPANQVVKIGDNYFLAQDKTTKVVLRDGNYYKPDLLKAFVLMVFVLLYLPCMAVIGVYIKEAKLKSTLFMLAYTTLTAYFVSAVVYWGGRMIGLG